MKDPKTIQNRLAELKLIPVVAIDEVDKAVPLAAALVEGGLPCAEITFRTEAAEAAIERMAEIDGFLVGAGTVLNVRQAERAEAAGASFIVSPGLDPDTVRWCLERGIPVFPGVATPTDLTVAVALGLDIVKLFPAEALGGLKMLKALAGPFPQMRFIPTGGIDLSNVDSWLEHPKVFACGGSWMVAKPLIAAGASAEVTRLVRKAVELVR